MDFHNIYEKHCLWSKKTFGPTENRSIDGVIEHIRKELDEVQEAAKELTENQSSPVGSFSGAVERQKLTSQFTLEVADIIILAMELAHVMGVGASHMCAMLTKKQDVNSMREWPDIDDQEPGKPIEHVRK